jgi:hypothetical protein
MKRSRRSLLFLLAACAPLLGARQVAQQETYQETYQELQNRERREEDKRRLAHAKARVHNAGRQVRK